MEQFSNSSDRIPVDSTAPEVQFPDFPEPPIEVNSRRSRISRRDFIKLGGSLGVAGIAASTGGVLHSEKQTDTPDYPTAAEVLGTYQYIGASAATYADANALSLYSGGEDGSISLPTTNGDDCANFVSNCLYAGGLPMTKGWHSYTQQQYKFGFIPTRIEAFPSKRWQFTPFLYTYLLDYGFATELEMSNPLDPNLFTGLYPGDLLFYDWGQPGQGITHVAMLTFPGIPSDGSSDQEMDLIDEHTSNRQGVPWQLTQYILQDFGENYDLSNVLIHRISINGNGPSY